MLEEEKATAETSEETATQEETETSTEKDGKKEEATVPSWRLREETEKRKRAEEELEALKSKPKPKEIDPKDIRGMLKKKLKPVYNQETGEFETSDEALETIAELSGRISDAKMKPVYERLASTEIRNQKNELRNLPHFRELEDEIDKLLAKMPIEQRMQEGSVMAVYKYAIGEKTIADSQEKANKKPGTTGNVIPHKTGSSSTITSTPKKLSPDQIMEFNKSWQPKGFDEEDYLDLLNRMIEQDKQKGFKTKRTLIGQTVSS